MLFGHRIYLAHYGIRILQQIETYYLQVYYL